MLSTHRSLAGIATRRALLLAALVLGLPPLAAPAAAQSPEQQAAEARALLARGGGFSVSVEMVRVPVVVVDEQGAFIEDLAQADFEIRDGGTNHRIEHFVSEAEPTSVGILLDASTQMAPYTDQVRTTVLRIAELLRGEDELFVIAYGADAQTLMPPTTERLRLAPALDGYRADTSERALYDGVARALSLLDGAAHDKRSLIVIGAGGDTASRMGELALQQIIHRTGVTVHAVVLAPPPARVGAARAQARVNRVQTLPELVRYSGGLVARRPNAVERFGGVSGWLDAAAADISRYVNHQYLLHYTPRNPPRSGTWRSIRVRVNVDFDHIRARSGYLR